MDNNNITLYNWAYNEGIDCVRKEEELKKIFISMDKTLRYLHDNNCIVDSFNPYDIQLINGDTNAIFYERFSPVQNPFNRDSLIKDNLFKFSCLQIGLYTNTLANIDFNFLKSNFDNFAENLPSELVPYYRGIILRNAGVYLCDFLSEKRNRDLFDMQRQLSSEDEKVEIKKINDDLTNKKLNDMIYKSAFEIKKKGGYNDNGMINIMLLIVIILVILIICSIITFIFI